MFEQFPASLEGLVAITMVFGTPIVIVIAILYYKARRTKMIHDTVIKLAEKSLPIPPELFADKEANEKSLLQRGVILIAIGAGLIAMFLAMPGGQGSWGIGMIPLLMGVGYLVVWKLEKKEQA